MVDTYIENNVTDPETMLLPVITPKDEEWEDLQVSFTWKFKNQPYEFHNGGQWPMVTGFYAADLAQRGKTELAKKHLDGIHRANRLAMDGAEWSFPEFLHGKTHEPGGVRHMSWSRRRDPRPTGDRGDEVVRRDGGLTGTGRADLVRDRSPIRP